MSVRFYEDVDEWDSSEDEQERFPPWALIVWPDGDTVLPFVPRHGGGLLTSAEAEDLLLRPVTAYKIAHGWLAVFGRAAHKEGAELNPTIERTYGRKIYGPVIIVQRKRFFWGSFDR